MMCNSAIAALVTILIVRLRLRSPVPGEFYAASGTPAFDEATLNVSNTEPDETPISLFHIQPKGLEFKGTPAEQN